MKNLTKQRHSIHFKSHLHKSYILEESQRKPEPTALWRWDETCIPVSPPFTLSRMVCPLSSPGKKEHNFNTDNSSNGLLDKWKEFHFLFLFTSIHYLWIFLQKGKRIGPAGLKVRPTNTQSWGKKRVRGLRSLWNSTLWIFVLGSNTHFSITKTARSSVVKKKLFALLNPDLPKLFDHRDCFFFYSTYKHPTELDSCGTGS